MSGTNLLARGTQLKGAVSLGLIFQHYLQKAIFDMVSNPANVKAKVAGSSLTAAQKDLLTNVLIDEYSSYKEYLGVQAVPTYYMNTAKILKDFAAIAQLAATLGTADADLNNFLAQYTDSTQKYMMSDEDEYKIAAEFMRLYLKAEVALAAKVDLMNS